MRAAGGTALAMGLALALIRGGLALGDAGLLVPPPEAVAESFLRSLQAHRYEPARHQLSSALAAATPAAELAAGQAVLEARLGRPRGVQGVPDGPGRAAAELSFADGRRVRVTFPVVREHGEWRLAGLEPLAGLP